MHLFIEEKLFLFEFFKSTSVKQSSFIISKVPHCYYIVIINTIRNRREISGEPISMSQMIK